MSRISQCSLALVVCAVVGHSQGAGPGIHTKSMLNAAINSQAPGSAISQISCQKVPGDKPGTWTVCMTVSGLPASLGGKGGDDVVMGHYDRLTNKLTVNNYAASLNTTGGDFGLMISPDGLHAVVDWPDGPHYASRSSLTSAFGAPAQVTGGNFFKGLFPPTYVDPALGIIGGKLYLFWVEGVQRNNVWTDIQAAPLDLSKPGVAKIPDDLVKNAIGVVGRPASGGPHSPTPVQGADGDTEGLWHAISLSPRVMVFDPDLDPTTPAFTVVSSTNWLNNGGVMGSYLVYRDDGQAKGVTEVRVAWLVGDDEPIGGKADITLAAPKTNAAPVTGVVFGAIKPITALTIPGYYGQYALDLATFISLGPIVIESSAYCP